METLTVEQIVEIKEHLYDLETALQEQEVRASAEKLAALIDDEYYEFGVSGTVWTKQDVIVALQNESFAVREICDFTVKLLSPDVALATYRCHRHATEGRASADSLRSSIWKCVRGQWRLIFHQGTALQSTNL